MELSKVKPITIFLFFLVVLLMNISKSLEIMEMHNITGTAKFRVRNNCQFKVWPAIVAEAGNKEASSSGFELGPAGDSKNVFIPAFWSGRVWGRTGCAEDPVHGIFFRCMTGDCGSSTVECTAGSGNVPVETTVVTLKLSGSSSNISGVTPLNSLPLTITKFSEETYKIDFCLPSSGYESINNHSSTAPARNGHKSIITSVAEFLLGVLIAVVAAAAIAFFKWLCQNNVPPQNV